MSEKGKIGDRRRRRRRRSKGRSMKTNKFNTKTAGRTRIYINKQRTCC